MAFPSAGVRCELCRNRNAEADPKIGFREVSQHVTERVLGIGLARRPTDGVLVRQLQLDDAGDEAVVAEHPFPIAAGPCERMGVGHRVDRRVPRLAHMGDDKA
jgi:hypothetical protein